MSSIISDFNDLRLHSRSCSSRNPCRLSPPRPRRGASRIHSAHDAAPEKLQQSRNSVSTDSADCIRTVVHFSPQTTAEPCRNGVAFKSRLRSCTLVCECGRVRRSTDFRRAAGFSAAVKFGWQITFSVRKLRIVSLPTHQSILVVRRTTIAADWRRLVRRRLGRLRRAVRREAVVRTNCSCSWS